MLSRILHRYPCTLSRLELNQNVFSNLCTRTVKSDCVVRKTKRCFVFHPSMSCPTCSSSSCPSCSGLRCPRRPCSLSARLGRGAARPAPRAKRATAPPVAQDEGVSNVTLALINDGHWSNVSLFGRIQNSSIMLQERRSMKRC